MLRISQISVLPTVTTSSIRDRSIVCPLILRSSSSKVRVRVADLPKVAKVSGVKQVQVSRVVKLNNALSEKFTGVDRTWEELKFTGKGQVVGVIDTGVDYTHADFGGPGTVEAYAAADAADTVAADPTLFGPDAPRVKGGYDFVGDDYDASAAGGSVRRSAKRVRLRVATDAAGEPP